MFKKFIYFSFFSFILFFILLFIFYPKSYAADPKLVSTIQKAFEKIQDWILKMR